MDNLRSTFRLTRSSGQSNAKSWSKDRALRAAARYIPLAAPVDRRQCHPAARADRADRVGMEFNVSVGTAEVPVAHIPPLAELFEGIAELPGSLSGISVTGVFDDSRLVQPGGLFVVVRGTNADGRRFIDEAVRRGATVIVGEELPEVAGVACVRVRDARLALAQLSARWYGLHRAPLNAMPLIGITGTNGKSTSAFMVRSILRAVGRPCGLLGTIEYDLVGEMAPANLTTPGPVQLAEYIRRAGDHGAQAVVLETSSHALDQRRTAGLGFRVGVFTNLTGDHLDYHKTMEDYAAAKARLFEALPADGVAVVNKDDAWTPRLVRDCGARVLTYSLAAEADITAKIVRETISGTQYKLRIGGTTVTVENPIVGRHNVYNALAAAGVGHALGVPVESIVAGLRSLTDVPGRLQRVPCGLPGEVFVDYAHTDDALLNVLSVLKPLTRGRLIVLFGCGGDRDKTKRPRMAAVAGQLADAIIVTSDNPRTEDPHDIIRDILAGFRPEDRKRVTTAVDRKAAINCAVSTLHPGDVLLIAGKGHENYQVIGHERTPFDDVDVAMRAAQALRPAGSDD
jgi:UDP-N-acetylmuramoyl-L-alanyl-D-glutamate--2,6-diaminopimelate ligase